MSPQLKKEYFSSIVKRYKLALRPYRSKILDEFCEVCGYNRKYAIHKLNTYGKKKPKKKPGKPSKYDNPELLKALKRIWMDANLPCSKNLKSMIPAWMKFMDMDQRSSKLLLEISPATIDRILKKTRTKHRHRGLSGTKPGTLIRKSIPIKVNQWNEFEPGFIEADTVHHCGTSLAGHYAVSLTMTDIASGWTECRATWGNGHSGTLDQIKHVKEHLPFKMLGFDSDCGGEFINYALLNYLNKNLIQFTRSRPYHKNDNAHVEQKNWTHVRQWLGYYRFENSQIVGLLNDLYINEFSLFHNFFIPSVKLIKKERIGSKNIKTHDKPKTPYQRLIDSDHIDRTTKDLLLETYSKLNPFELRKTIESKLKAIFKLASNP